MDTIVTYLLGAGASAKAIPTVAKFISYLDELRGFISVNRPSITEHNSIMEKTMDKFSEDILALSRSIQNHASIDTYAKKLWIMNRYPEMNKLKSLMTSIFLFKQASGAFDIRYDAFFASLLKSKSLIMPNNIRMLSWNYDSQLEMGLLGFTTDKSFSPIQNALRMQIKTAFRSDVTNMFTVYKINGSAEFSKGLPTNDILGSVKYNIWEKYALIMNNYIENGHLDNSTLISFAWENDDSIGMGQPNIVDGAIQAIKDTKILVVIGYSFPYFNREIDRKMLNSMTKLRKVYVQAPDAGQVSQRMVAAKDSWDSIELMLHNEIEQFMIPNEL